METVNLVWNCLGKDNQGGVMIVILILTGIVMAIVIWLLGMIWEAIPKGEKYRAFQSGTKKWVGRPIGYTICTALVLAIAAFLIWVIYIIGKDCIHAYQCYIEL